MANSSQGRQAQPTSNELDLDALERQIVEPRAHALTMMDGQTILSLIQRLREAERQREATYRSGLDAVGRLDERLREATARLAERNDHIFQLAERIAALEAALRAIE